MEYEEEKHMMHTPRKYKKMEMEETMIIKMGNCNDGKEIRRKTKQNYKTKKRIINKKGTRKKTHQIKTKTNK